MTDRADTEPETPAAIARSEREARAAAIVRGLELRALVRRYVTRAAILGVLAAIVCHCVPPEYRAACELVARVCTLGSSG